MAHFAGALFVGAVLQNLLGDVALGDLSGGGFQATALFLNGVFLDGLGLCSHFGTADAGNGRIFGDADKFAVKIVNVDAAHVGVVVEHADLFAGVGGQLRVNVHTAVEFDAGLGNGTGACRLAEQYVEQALVADGADAAAVAGHHVVG